MLRMIPCAVLTAVVLAEPVLAQSAPPLATYELPAAVTFPEGIAADPSGFLYTASAETGEVVRVNARTKSVETVVAAGLLIPSSAPRFPGVLGMKLDANGRLWIAGGVQSRMFVVDTRTGRLLKQLDVPTAGALINDAALVGGAAYFTDTRTPTLWRITSTATSIGDLEPWLNFTGSPLLYEPGLNLNGIAATPDGRSLIVVQMDKGLLFRIDIATKAVTKIDTGGADLSGSDGLVLDGSTLYIVRQTAVEIVTATLSADLSKATVVNRFKDPLIAWPATAAKVGNDLVIVNTQFNVRAAKTHKVPFTLVSIPVARLQGR